MRGMGDTTAYLRRGIREIICLALFFFTFLACEYLFDVRMAEFVSPNEVVIYESLVIGASVIGFFVRPILYYRRPHAIDATSDVTGVLLVAALLLLIMAVQVEVVIAGGLVACCALGYCGSTAHANFARRFARTPCLARAAALSYAMGVLVQVLNHMVMPVGIPQQAVLVVCAIAQVALLHGARRAKLRDESDPSFEPSAAGLSVDALEYGAKWHDDPEAKAAFRRAVVRLTVATAYLSSVFAALNAGFTTLHAVGTVDLGDWPCMGRVVNNVCSMFVTAPAVAIISSQNVLAAVGAALVMFVGIAITLLGQLGQRADDAAMRDGLPLATDDLGGDLAPTCSDPEPVEAAEPTSDERLDAFVVTFGLTRRERDILEVLVVSDQSVQDIATTLFLSRSTLYRHISSINKKTGTASRVALINFFWSWTPKD